MRRDVFQAIADPNRRAILELIASNPSTINEIARHFSISRPAISRHIKILEDCGAVSVSVSGRQRTCYIVLEAFHPLMTWLKTFNGQPLPIPSENIGSFADYLKHLSPDNE